MSKRIVTIKFEKHVDGWKRGDEATVPHTPFIDKWVKYGIIRILKDSANDGVQEPARNASRDAWVDFLTASGFHPMESAPRGRLIDDWDRHRRGLSASSLFGEPDDSPVLDDETPGTDLDDDTVESTD